MLFNAIARTLGAVLLYLFVGGPVRANVITFLGNIQQDNQMVWFTVDVTDTTNVDIRSVGYAGGITDAGVVPAGGFDSYLTLFDSMGNFVVENDDSDSATVDPNTNQAFDAGLTLTLTPGVYGLVLTQYGNYSVGPNDVAYGFSEQSNSSYTTDPGYAAGAPCSSGLFQDNSGTDGRCRTGNYAIEFQGSDSATAWFSLVADPQSGPHAPVPEAKPCLMLSFGLLALLSFQAAIRRKRPVETVSTNSGNAELG